MVSDVGALDLPGEDRAGLHRLAVDVHDAGAALRGVAADMGAGEPQVLAQELHQQGARIDVTGDGFAVHRQCDGGHGFLLEIRPKASFFAPTGGADGGSGQNRVDFAPRRGLEQVNSEPAGARPVKGIGDRDESSAAMADASSPDCATAAANLAKKSSAIFLAALLIRRWPSWASLPPICASTS